MSSRNISLEEMNKLSFGNQEIHIKIPKFTDVLIITTISQATNGTSNVNTKSYVTEEIKELLKGDK